MSSSSTNRSGATSGTGYSASSSSQRSITSSIALEQLRKLDDVLMRERQAREEAERTLTVLQQERAEKDAATRRSEKTERQLETILSTLGRVLEHPEDMHKLRQLQRVALEGATSAASSSERSSYSSSSSKRSKSSSQANSSERSYGGSSRSSYSSYTSNDSTRSSGVRSSSSSKSDRNDDRKAKMLSTGAAALLAASGPSNKKGTSSRKFKETFFEKFGTGDDRQKRALDRAYFSGDKDGIKPAGGRLNNNGAAAGGSNNNNNGIPTRLPSQIGGTKRVDSKTMTNSSLAFTHHKSDLRPMM